MAPVDGVCMIDKVLAAAGLTVMLPLVAPVKEPTHADAQRVGPGRVEDQVAEGGHTTRGRDRSRATAGETAGPLAMVM